MLSKPEWHKKIAFLCIGVLNTLVDISIYTALVANGWLPIFFANIISTSAGIACSYTLNRRFTFKSNASSRKMFVMFFIITAFGLWILQPIVIWSYGHIISDSQLSPWHYVNVLIPKMIATVVTLVWNFVLYDKLVFRHHGTNESANN